MACWSLSHIFRPGDGRSPTLVRMAKRVIVEQNYKSWARRPGAAGGVCHIHGLTGDDPCPECWATRILEEAKQFGTEGA